MNENIELRLDRTEKLDELENKSDAMAAASTQFHKGARQLQKRFKVTHSRPSSARPRGWRSRLVWPLWQSRSWLRYYEVFGSHKTWKPLAAGARNQAQ